MCNADKWCLLLDMARSFQILFYLENESVKAKTKKGKEISQYLIRSWNCDDVDGEFKDLLIAYNNAVDKYLANKFFTEEFYDFRKALYGMFKEIMGE